MGSYLVVANETLGGEALAAHLRQVIDADPSARFVVLAPVSTAAPVDLGGSMGVMSGIAMVDPALQDQLKDVARERLRLLLAWFRDAGVEAEGAVVGDPMAAMEAAVAANNFDEIIVSTLPARLSRWLRLGLVHRAARRFDVPITTIAAADETLASTVTKVPVEPSTPSVNDGISRGKRAVMADSVYKIVELVGTSTESWEQAAAAAVAKASQTLRDLRVAEIVELDMVIEDGAVTAYRAKIKVSFKYDGED